MNAQPWYFLRRIAIVTAVLASAFVITATLLAQDAPKEPPADPESTPAAEPTVTVEVPSPPMAHPLIELAEAEEENEESSTFGLRHTSEHMIVVYNDDAVLPKGRSVKGVIAIGGSSTVRGSVSGAVVSILGTSRTESDIRGTVIAVFGNAYVDGTADTVLAAFGGVTLGPHAVVRNAVSVGGPIKRAPGAVVRGVVQDIGFIRKMPDFTGFHRWTRHALLLGRPLAIVDNLEWPWAVAGAFLGVYLALAALFSRGIYRCAQTLETRPGRTVLATFVCLVLIPIVSILLSITVIGPFVAFVAIVFAVLFGKAALLAWCGRKIAFGFGDGSRTQTVLAVLIGAVVLTGFYLIPVVGLVMWKVTSVLALGVVFYTIILSLRRPVPAVVAGSPIRAMPEPAVVTPTSEGSDLYVDAAMLPRAGFWIRIGALAIDVVVVGAASAFLEYVPLFLVLLATYGAVMWKLKSTTIGGIVCGLRIVRLDQRPISWTTAIVRALACFLSLVTAGLGFIWLAIDDEKQTWHDKIAGTVVVHAPRGVSLV